MVDSKIGAIRAQLLGRDGELDGLQEHVRGRTRLRLRRGRPMPEREEPDLLHSDGLLMPGLMFDRGGPLHLRIGTPFVVKRCTLPWRSGRGVPAALPVPGGWWAGTSWSGREPIRSRRPISISASRSTGQ